MRFFPKVEILDDKEFEKTMGDEVLANRGLADFPDVASRKLWDEFVHIFSGFYSRRYETIYVRNGHFSLRVLVHEFIHHVENKLNTGRFLGNILHKFENRKIKPIEIMIHLDGDAKR